MKIKKILSFVTALTISFGAMQIVNNYSPDIINAAESDDFEFVDVNVTVDGMRFKVYSDHAELLACLFNGKDELILPETVEGVPLTVLGEGCLISKNFKKVVIPDNIKTISTGAFAGCNNLETVTIPEGIETIEAGTFDYCNSLKTVNLPDSLKEIKREAFKYCKSLESIKIPDGVVSIDEEAFTYCENLKNISLPDSITKIGTRAFSICTNLESVELPKSLKSVSDGLFFMCNNLRSVNIPEGVTHIGSDAFYQCMRLEELSLPNSLEEIGENAFFHCDNLVSVTVPEKIDSFEFYSKNIGSLTVMNPEFDFDNAFQTYCSIDVIYGYEGSTAEEFAGKFNIKFEAIDEESSSETADKPVNGDANCDGKVDMSDIVLIMQVLANPNKYGVNGTEPSHITSEGFKYADTDGNGLTVNDAQRIQLYLLGKLKSLG